MLNRINGWLIERIELASPSTALKLTIKTVHSKWELNFSRNKPELRSVTRREGHSHFLIKDAEPVGCENREPWTVAVHRI
jgi:hypothetical protein